MTATLREPVSSVTQDNWCELADLFWRNLMRLAMVPTKPGDPPLTPEEMCRLLELSVAVRDFQAGCLTFDAQQAALLERIENGSHGCNHGHGPNHGGK